MARKKSTGLHLKCRCEAVAPVFLIGENRWMAQCAGCGAITFFRNPLLLERLRHGGALCSHKPEPRPCRGGSTTWCPLCRVRTFYYRMGGEEGIA